MPTERTVRASETTLHLEPDTTLVVLADSCHADRLEPAVSELIARAPDRIEVLAPGQLTGRPGATWLIAGTAATLTAAYGTIPPARRRLRLIGPHLSVLVHEDAVVDSGRAAQ